MPAGELLDNGMGHLGTYHPNKPLKINKKGKIVSQSFPLLFYYSNRLDNYHLNEALKPFFQQWKGNVELTDEDQRMEEIGEEGGRS